MFPIGSGIQAYDATLEFYKSLDFWQPFESAVHVVVINSMNDKGRIYEAQRRLPKSLIVARLVVTTPDGVELDGAYHLQPLAPGDTNYYLVSPENLMNLIEPLAEQDAVLYWGNEPSGEVDPVTFDRLVAHTIMGIRIANSRRRRLCILNWGVGHPFIINGILDPRLKPIIQAMNDSPIEHYWGLHLYKPADTVRALKALKELCRTQGLRMPKVIITEWGYDAGYPGDPRNGYKSQPGVDGRQLASETIEQCKGEWREFFEDGTVVGVVGFCEGGEPKQHNFNYANDQGYKDRLKEALQSGELAMKRQTGTFPKYYPGVKPVSADFPHLYRVELPPNLSSRNIRALNDEASNRLGEVHSGDEVKVYDTPTEFDNMMRKWQFCEVVKGDSLGVSGWLYVGGGLSLMPILPQSENPDPPPATENPPTPQPPIGIPVGCPETFNTTMSHEQMTAFAQKLRTIEAAYRDMAAFVESLVKQPDKPEGVPSVQVS